MLAEKIVLLQTQYYYKLEICVYEMDSFSQENSYG